MAIRDAIRVIARNYMGRVCGDDVVDWAELELDAGNSTPSIIALSGFAKPTHWSDVSDLFQSALSECGYDLPPRNECLREYARNVAEDVLNERVSPTDGCVEITIVCELLDSPQDLHSYAWMELVSGYDPGSSERATADEIERHIRCYCALLLRP